MSKLSRLSAFVLVGALAGVPAFSQSIVSAHSGTVHYIEGDVSVQGRAIEWKPARFTELKSDEVLRTGQGRAEILLTPGVFLRVAENSAVRMLDNRLLATRVEVLSGSVMLESDDPQMGLKDTPVTLIYGDYQLRAMKHGLVEMATEPAEVRVYKGSAEVNAPTARVEVHEGRKVALGETLTAVRFDAKTADDLYLWSRDRSESLSAANMAAARRISAEGTSGFASGGGAWNGGWYYNPWLSMFTWVPARGVFDSPFGFGFFSPGTIYSTYSPVYSFAPGTLRSAGVIAAMNPANLSGATTAGAPQLGSPLRSGGMVPGSNSPVVGRGSFPSLGSGLGATPGMGMGPHIGARGGVGR